ncbi:M24 family metallopeptidase [Roseateles saccharophilus]|uniref:Xaa-Pro dipeptidase n=1 Tax=Roseateles saccharophilus TaxID=304 RepID=A0A4R3VF39_ROSSA|nr:Xaa-Pro peptidase family protein [Roseateles saccharophilus]MDG0833864.1 aminopeptidase P family protein [Roseateles saccharophilus]TCV02314.1 Xaa-Pro dipeptidase [Roseateles saccharophilus]
MNKQIGHLTLAQAQALLASPLPGRPAAISAAEYAARIAQARALMREAGVDALLVTAGQSLRYFTGIAWGASERLVALLLTAEGEPLLIAPAFEEGSLDAVLRIPAAKRLWQEHQDPHALVAVAMAERGARRLALDPEAAFRVSTGLRRHLAVDALVDAQPIIDGCRMCKSAAELALMQHACDITLQVQRLAAGIAREDIGSDELVRFIDQAHRALGADGGSTFCIVQFGHATAYPHGIPGVQHLKPGELVLIDTGCSIEGYNSDVTRTWIFGEADEEQRRIWALERAAQQAAFDAVRPGVRCEAVDQAARDVLEAAGLGPDYRLPGLPHRTGHGCGLAIHEAPYLVRGNAQRLAPGMCCSNEPMIVVPGRFGVRLEDHFHVTEGGAQWFTPPSVAIDQPFSS